MTLTGEIRPNPLLLDHDLVVEWQGPSTFSSKVGAVFSISNQPLTPLTRLTTGRTVLYFDAGIPDISY
jgi:hypothetical protein